MLEDVLTKNLNIVFCGTAKGKLSVQKGFYYAGNGNKFYGVLHRVGLTQKRLLPRDCYSIIEHGIGLTDLVHAECGNDNQISSNRYDVDGFMKKMEIYQPMLIGFTSKKAASFAFGFNGFTSFIDYGLQNFLIRKSKVFVLPSTSGNARKYWNERYWYDLKDLIQQSKLVENDRQNK